MTAATRNSLIADPAAVLARAPLFHGLSGDQRARLLQTVIGLRQMAGDEVLVHEDEPAEQVYVIVTGSFAVVRHRPGSSDHYPIATLWPGMTVGEIAVLDPGHRTTTIRAREPSMVLAIRLAGLKEVMHQDPTLDLRIKANLAPDLAQRLRATNESMVTFLGERLDEAEKRAELSRFLTRVLIGISLYVFSMGVISALPAAVGASVVNVAVLSAFAIGVVVTMRSSPYPLSAYGITIATWRRDVAWAVAWSLPAMALVVAVKGVLVNLFPELAGDTVFQLSRGSAGGSFGGGGRDVALAVLYAAFCPVQELIARCGIQSSCEMLLAGRYRELNAILLSNLLFSATHMHVGLPMAVAVFPGGLFWGWLFWRRRSLVGVSVSHAVIGTFAFSVVGFDFLF